MAKRIEIPIPDDKMYNIRRLSTMVYLVHQLVNGVVVVALLENVIGLDLITTSRFIIVLVVTFILSIAMVVVSRKKTKAGALLRSMS